jgi:hypothetical protein
MPGTKYLYDFLRDKEGIKKKGLTPEGRFRGRNLRPRNLSLLLGTDYMIGLGHETH